MTRIVAGAAGGRRLAVPRRPGPPARPRTAPGRACSRPCWPSAAPLDGATVLDLYAGSGAVGLEALSRGAADVLLVESDARAARVIRGNIAAVRLPGARLIADRAERVLARGPGDAPPRDLVFADPPYATPADEVRGAHRAARPRLARARRAGRGGARHPVGPAHLARRVSA